MDIGQTNKLFGLAEARELLALLRLITEQYQTELAPIQARLNRMLSNDPRRARIEQQYEAVVSRWRTKVEQLGALVKGLWIIEFDVGEGTLCWRYPEVSLNYFRPHGAPFSARRRLRDYIEENDPDWAHRD